MVVANRERPSFVAWVITTTQQVHNYQWRYYVLPLATELEVLMEPFITELTPLTSLTQIGMEISFSPIL